jgi:hypothetical protein
MNPEGLRNPGCLRSSGGFFLRTFLRTDSLISKNRQSECWSLVGLGWAGFGVAAGSILAGGGVAGRFGRFSWLIGADRWRPASCFESSRGPGWAALAMARNRALR